MRTGPIPAAALLSAVLALAPAHALEEADTVVAGEVGERLDRAVQRATGGGFWGVVLVARGGEVLLAKGYGYADYGRRPMTSRSLFEIASASKPFAAVAVLRLAKAGKLRLSDPLTEFFGEVPPDKRAITVRQLLTHTSGISPGVGLPYVSRASRDELVRHVLAAPLAAEPGRKFAYCNFGYALVAAIVEVASGRPFEEYLREEVFGRAGMGDTGFIGDGGLDAGRVTARLSESLPDATAVNWHWGWGYRGMGGIVTTAWDLYRFDRALLGVKLLGRKALEQAFTPEQGGYALGWLVETTPRGTRRIHHSGGVEGYAVNVVRFPEDDVFVAALSNGRSDLRAVGQAIEEILFPRPRITARVDVSPYPRGEVPVYEFDEGFEWRVARDGEAVRLSLVEKARDHVLAEIVLPPGEVRPLRERLARLTAAGGGSEARTMHVGAYLQPYALADGRVEIGDGLSIRLMPRYTGQDEAGNLVVDERITFVLEDSIRGQWPVMAKMDRKSAEDLLSSLGR